MKIGYVVNGVATEQPEYTTTATIKDIMLGIVDPSADDVWNAVQTVVGPNGIEEHAPKTEEEWTTVRHGAIRLVEATNLLMIPGRHVAKPHEKSETPGIELEPEEMEVLINKDRPAFYKRARALHDVAALASWSGGRDKGGGYALSAEQAKGKVKLALVFGEARDVIAQAMQGICPVRVVSTLAEAVDVAHGEAASGDVVLLSPACSSWDQFKNYEERGNKFKALVNDLGGGSQ